MSTPDEPIAEVRVADLDSEVPRRCLLSFELLAGLEEDLADTLYQRGPAGVREMGADLAEAFSVAAEFMEAAQRLGWGQHEAVGSASGVELVRTAVPASAYHDFTALPQWRNPRARLWTELQDEYVPVVKG